MKIKILLLATFLASAMDLRAATNDLTSLLQQGLFDEEANHDLTSAIADYQSLATQFDRDRQVAATAIYRLGECYRKLGETNEAVNEYERIIKEFGEQKDLVTLSQQNLTGLGALGAGANHFQDRLEKIVGHAVVKPPLQATTETDTASGEAQLLKAQLAGLDQLASDPEKRAFAVLALFPDGDLKEMLLHLVTLNKQVNDIMDTNLAFPLDYIAGALNQNKRFGHLQCPTNRADALLLAQTQTQKQLEPIEQRVSFIIGLQQARLQVLQNGADLANGKPKEADATASTDGEDRQIQRIQEMLQNSPDLINANGIELNQAARSGELRVATFLLDHGANVNGNDRQNIPLIMAAQNAQKSMVDLLLSRGADVNAHDGTGNTALLAAAKAGYQAVVETLLAHKADVNARNSSSWGETPLHLAAGGGYANIVHLLLAAGTSPNAPDDRPQVPLIPAITSGSLESVRLLLEAGADPNLENYLGRTPVSYAAESGSPEMLKLLLDAKGNPNGGKLDAPLLCAIQKKDLVSAELLLKAGADPNSLDRFEQEGPGSMTPLHLAVVTRQLAMAQLLLKYHADPNDEQTDQRPVIFNALADTNILETLLDAGAHVEARDTTGSRYNNKAPDWTPLIMAVRSTAYPEQNSPVESVAILLRHGANPNVPDDAFGTPPLFWTAGWSFDRVPNHDVLELLLDHQADPNQRNFGGETLLGGLKLLLNKYPERQALINNAIDLLRQHGALDNLPDWNHITASRLAANFTRAAFTRHTNEWNQFTLLELVAVECQFLAVSPYGGDEALYDRSVFWSHNQPLPFADLARLRIRRPEPDLTNATEQTVDLAASLTSGDCANDVFLKWGDVVEIPESDHPINETWPGFSMIELTNLAKCLTRHVQIIVKGQTNAITLAPEIDFDGTATFADRLKRIQDGAAQFPQPNSIHKVSFWLGPVLLQSKLVLASSDLAHVKVTRLDPTTGKARECIVDCSAISQNQYRDSDLWLRDGDVIEVPEKP